MNIETALKSRSYILDLDHVKLSLEIFYQLSGSTFIFVKNTDQKAANLPFCLISPVAKTPAWFLEGQYMPHWWPMYLFWGLSNSSFRAVFAVTVFAQTGVNWFLTASKQPNLQTKKRYCRFHQQDFWTKYFFFLWYDDVYRAEGHTAVDICVKRSWKKLYLKILMRETCLGFFNIYEFYRSCNFGGFCWILKNIQPAYCTYQNLHMTFTNILSFLLNFSTSWKICEKEQWPLVP